MKSNEIIELEMKDRRNSELKYNIILYEADHGVLQVIEESANLVALSFYYKYKSCNPKEKPITHSIQIDIVRMDSVLTKVSPHGHISYLGNE